jgi:hypothetical protein
VEHRGKKDPGWRTQIRGDMRQEDIVKRCKAGSSEGTKERTKQYWEREW